MEELEVFAEELKKNCNRELSLQQLQRLSDEVKRLLSDTSVDRYLLLCASLFRCLRNACAGCSTNQKAIFDSPTLLDGSLQICKRILQRLENSPVEENVVIAARCGLQFLGNLVVQNEVGQIALWEKLSFEKNLLRNLLCHWDEKLSLYAAFFLFNCLASQQFLQSLNDVPDLVSALIQQLTNFDSEWSLFSLESLIQKENFMNDIYPAIPIDNRLLLLDVMTEQLGCSPLKPHIILEASRLFRDRAPNVVVSSEKDVLETSKLLTLLCDASSLEGSILQHDVPLLETCLDVLRVVHTLGKNTSNHVFSPVQSLSQDSPPPHASHGFKAQLVRLLGNLVHHSPTNQDAVRSLDGMHLLLDCCPIDAKNPFITQWCVFAIRNLMEGNVANQSALAEVTLGKPSLADSPLLRELGLELTTEGKLQRHS